MSLLGSFLSSSRLRLRPFSLHLSLSLSSLSSSPVFACPSPRVCVHVRLCVCRIRILVLTQAEPLASSTLGLSTAQMDELDWTAHSLQPVLPPLSSYRRQPASAAPLRLHQLRQVEARSDVRASELSSSKSKSNRAHTGLLLWYETNISRESCNINREQQHDVKHSDSSAYYIIYIIRCRIGNRNTAHVSETAGVRAKRRRRRRRRRRRKIWVHVHRTSQSVGRGRSVSRVSPPPSFCVRPSVRPSGRLRLLRRRPRSQRAREGNMGDGRTDGRRRLSSPLLSSGIRPRSLARCRSLNRSRGSSFVPSFVGH